jgi:hypothetical protein
VTCAGEVLFHPAAFASGLSDADTVGETVSIAIAALAWDGYGEASPSAYTE